ncbi:unnamed protein product [Boreogadus saida]
MNQNKWKKPNKRCARCTATVRTTPPGSGGGLTTWNALPAAASAPASTTPVAGSPQRAGVQAGRQFRSAQLGSMGGNLPAAEGPLEGQPERCRSRQRPQRFLIYDCLLPG